MTSAPAGDVWVFDDFHPGARLGDVSIPLDADRMTHWAAIYGKARTTNHVPAGMLVAAMMEAYLTVVRPRPPGNIHANQKLAFGGTAKPGDRLEAEVRCLNKVLRNERRWITLDVRLRNGAQDVLRGEITTIWAR